MIRYFIRIKDYQQLKYKVMGTYKLTFSDGDPMISQFNGNIKAANKYWLNKSFTYWDGIENKELSRKVVKVELIK